MPPEAVQPRERCPAGFVCRAASADPYSPDMVEPAAPVRRDVGVVLAVQALAVALVAGWFATGHPSAPDAGLLQIDLLSLSERVPGLVAVDGRPTMVVLTCPDRLPGPDRRLDEAYGLIVSTDPSLAQRLALPLATAECRAGYALLDGDSVVRYRTYDPGWPQHSFEQEVLLEHLAGPHG